jgi:hypothetical protein
MCSIRMGGGARSTAGGTSNAFRSSRTPEDIPDANYDQLLPINHKDLAMDVVVGGSPA